jgi:spore coat polysaccharide biosynthesis protein SpsF
MVKVNNYTLAVLQARMSSSRLPGKVMKFINGKPMIFYQINRILQSEKVDDLIVATSIDKSDDSLVEYLIEQNIKVYRGDLLNVFSRFCEIERIKKPSAIIRLTADCPFTMPQLIDQMVDVFYKEEVDYLSNTLQLTYPDGVDIEIIKNGVLEKLGSLQLSDLEKEHVTLGIINHSNLFLTKNFSNSVDISHYRWTVETEEDFNFVNNIFCHFTGKELTFTLYDLFNYFMQHPEQNLILSRK